MAIAIGQEAPPFEGQTDRGETIRLEDYRGKKFVVLFFYPGDFTPVCTKEACGFRDMYEELAAKDTEVIGVSPDSKDSHEKFRARYSLPFPLVADHDKKLSEAFGATGFLSSLFGKTSRRTYVLDKDLIVRAVIDAQLSAAAHTSEVERAIAALRAGSAHP